MQFKKRWVSNLRDFSPRCAEIILPLRSRFHLWAGLDHRLLSSTRFRLSKSSIIFSLTTSSSFRIACLCALSTSRLLGSIWGMSDVRLKPNKRTLGDTFVVACGIYCCDENPIAAWTERIHHNHHSAASRVDLQKTTIFLNLSRLAPNALIWLSVGRNRLLISLAKYLA